MIRVCGFFLPLSFLFILFCATEIVAGKKKWISPSTNGHTLVHCHTVGGGERVGGGGGWEEGGGRGENRKLNSPSTSLRFDFETSNSFSRVSFYKPKKKKKKRYRKAVAYMQFWNLLVFLVRLLFEGGLYGQSWVCKTRKSGLAHVKWKWNVTLRLFHNYFKCKQTFGTWKAVGFSPTSRARGRIFELGF